MPELLQLAEVDTAFLMSVYKPVIVAVVLGFWAKAVGVIDNDLETVRHYVPQDQQSDRQNVVQTWQRRWNLINLGGGIAAFGLWFVVGNFWLGLLIAIAIIACDLLGYAMFRNVRVTEDKKWTFDPKSWIAERRDAARHAGAQEDATYAFINKGGDRIDVPAGDDPRVAAHELLGDILGFALPRQAERFDIVIGKDRSIISVQVDGVRYPQPDADNAQLKRVVDYIKENAGLDVEDVRRKQNANVTIEAEETGQHVLGVTTIGSTKELQLTVVFDPDKRVSMKVEELGLLPAQLESLKAIFRSKNRTVIVATPPKQGQTTTLYSLMQKHDPYTQSIVTLEEEVAFEIEGVTHNTIESGTSPDAVAEELAKLTRQDPHALLLGRLADVKVAKTIAATSQDIRFYVGMRQDDTFTALRAYIKAVGDSKAAAASLEAVLSQRLIRRLCHTCRQAYQPDPAALKKMNLPADQASQWYKHSGKIPVKKDVMDCPSCHGMGYMGRLAVFEVMVLDDNARKLIAGGQLDQLRGYLRKQKMLWLQEAALMRVIDGETDIAEIGRVTSGEK